MVVSKVNESEFSARVADFLLCSKIAQPFLAGG